MQDRVVHAEVNYTKGMDARPQFHANDRSLDRVDLDPRIVAIVDARRELDRPNLQREGFALFACPTEVADFRNVEEVARVYPEEMRRFVLEVTGADAVVVIGPAILRFAERSEEAGTRDNSRAARLVHIDVSDAAAAEFARAAKPAHVQGIRRVAQHNIWRSFSGPPQDVPLALCDSRTVATSDLVLADARFDRNGKIVHSFESLLLRFSREHRWHFFSDMRQDEVVVFKRHETESGEAHAVPHTAFTDPSVGTEATPRASAEMRTIAYWFD